MHLLAALAIGSALFAQPQQTIQHLDFYGLRSVDESTVRAALGFAEGSSTEVDRVAATRRVEAIAGIEEARIILMLIPGSEIVLVGVRETNAPVMTFKSPPKGDCRLPDGVLQAYDAFIELSYQGIMKRVSGERIEGGYSMSDYRPAAEQEEVLRELAWDYPEEIVRVVRESRDAAERAAAAKAISYLEEKDVVVEVLAGAITDPDPTVRNNAMRALGILARWAKDRDDFAVEFDISPVIVLLESIDWTDRNKATALLEPLTATRDPDLLERLRRGSIPALAEMASWHSVGHAYTSVVMLGRLAELSDEEVRQRDASARKGGDVAHRAWIEELSRRAADPAAAEDEG